MRAMNIFRWGGWGVGGIYHIVPVTSLESFRVLKLSRLENFRARKFANEIGGF